MPTDHPFDRALYDAVMAEAQGEPWSKEKMDIYRVAAWRAARISANRGPVIPEGWRLQVVVRMDHGDKYMAVLRHTSRTEVMPDGFKESIEVDSTGPTWIDALTAAINAAKEGDDSETRKIYIKG